ncbi:MAG: hypothetical protein OXU73_00015 [Candidatus Campbellbacteria bacterium]|nr:hypothetical protein [Candidatus Campbellbacteria bacterium]
MTDIFSVEIIPFIALGMIGGFVRGLVGFMKSTKSKKKFDLLYLSFSLITGIVLGGFAGVFVTDPRFALLAGYAGTDFIEGLYKMNIKPKLTPPAK